MTDRQQRLTVAAVALLVIQVVHGAIPAETDAEGYTGLIAGVIALGATVAALVGLVRGRSWAPPLLGITGASVAVGFLLYHALPITSPLTNPYFGEDNIGLAQWAPVIAAILIGAWCALEAWTATTRERSTQPT